MLSRMQIDFSPLLPPGVLLALFIVIVAVLALAGWRRARGLLWRGIAAACLFAGLLNPSLVSEERSYFDDVAVIVLDQSASQKVGDRQKVSEATLATLQEQLKQYENLDVRVVRAPLDARRGMGEGTRLFDALTGALADVPSRRVAGAILITDGQIHDVPATLADLGFKAPVHTLLTGTADEGDRRLLITKAPAYGIVDQEVQLSLRVDDLGGGGGRANVTLFQDGQRKAEMVLPIGVEHEMSLKLDRAGPTVLEFKVDQGPKELSLANNSAVTVINGVRDRLRVLLISGDPHPGERTWRNILKSDPAVDLVHFTILRPPEKQDGTPINELSLIAFPIRELFEVKLDEFDLVIFDRYRQRGVLPRAYFDNIARYVEAGGALLDAAGAGTEGALGLTLSPLQVVLPAEPSGKVIEAGFRPQLTAAGKKHPVTAGLDGGRGDKPNWGRWFRIIQGNAMRGVTVMSGTDNAPLLILDRVGEGRVAQLMSDQIWLWSRGFEGGGPQAELLRRIAHWLMKEPELEEEDLRAVVIDGRLEITRRSLGDQPKQVDVTTPSGEAKKVALTADDSGRATGAIPAEEDGLYRVTDGTRTAFAASGDLNPVEMADLRSSETAMAPLAEASGGGIYRLAEGGLPQIRRVRADRDTAGSSWLGLKANEDHIVTGVDQLPLLPAILLLLLALGMTVTAWWREGR
ncbi:MAG TPA: hypothetical protein VMT98_14895 [Verrucomicrobiae bacterium]|nr:hypothetical protein [Verrucomicrobiae bacterium]